LISLFEVFNRFKLLIALFALLALSVLTASVLILETRFPVGLSLPTLHRYPLAFQYWAICCRQGLLASLPVIGDPAVLFNHLQECVL
jgi:hypothetical protein